MFLALVLSASTASPAPSLADLKTIASVRATPLCTALRNSIGPAVAGLLANDATIDKAPPAITRSYKHQLLTPTGAGGQPTVQHFTDLGNLESLIGPLVDNLKRVDDLLADKNVFPDKPASDDQRRLAQIKGELDGIEVEQKAALNAIAGYDATAQTYQILTEDESQGLHVASPSARSFSQFDPAGIFGGALVSTQGPRSTPGRFDPSLAYNPLHPLADYISAVRAQGQTDETAAAALIAPILASCQAR